MVQSLDAPLDSSEDHPTGCRRCQEVYVGDHVPAVHKMYFLVGSTMVDKRSVAAKPGQHMIMV